MGSTVSASLIRLKGKPTHKGLDSLMNVYNQFSLSQIESALDLWLEGEHGDERKLPAPAFDTILGGLLDDSDVHFNKLRDPDDFTLPLKCNLLDVFLIMAIFSGEDNLKRRLNFVYCLYFVVVKFQAAKNNKESLDEAITMRSAQGNARPYTTSDIKDLFFAILECLKKVFDLQIPTKYKSDLFATDLIVNYRARCDPRVQTQLREEEDVIGPQESAVELFFDEFWKMCQDSTDIIKILDFIEGVRHELKTQRSGIFLDTCKPTRALSFENKQNALWKYRAIDMVDDSFYEHMPSLDLSLDIFTALEHSVLSTNRTSARAHVLPMLRNLGADEEDLWVQELLEEDRRLGHNASIDSKTGSTTITATGLAMSASRTGLAASSSKARAGQGVAGNVPGSSGGMGSSASRSGLVSRTNSSDDGAPIASMMISASRSGLKTTSPRAGTGGGASGGLGVSTSRSVIGSSNKAMSVSTSKSLLGVSASKSILGAKNASYANLKMKGAQQTSGIKRVDSMVLAKQREQTNASMAPGSPISPKAPGTSNSSLSSLRSKAHNQSVASLVQRQIGGRGSSGVLGGRGNERVGSSSSMKSIAQEHSSTRSLLSDDGMGGTQEFCGLFDVGLIVAYLASCLPDNMVHPSMKLVPGDEGGDTDHGTVEVVTTSNDAIDQMRQSYFGGREVVKDENYYRKAQQVNMNDLVDVMRHLHLVKEHIKLNVMELWTKLGLRIAGTDLANALFDKENPIHEHRPFTGPATFLTLENSLYRVVEILSYCHKGVPLCTDPEKPSKVTHVIDQQMMADFLYHRDVEFFETTLMLPIIETDMVRKTPTISVKHNLASALTFLKERDLDSALVVDEEGCACGVVTTEIVIKLWRAWWTYCNEDLEGDLTLDEMRELYSRGAFPHFDGYPRGFNVFGVLVNPLDKCQLVGVHVEKLREYMESELASMMANKKVNMAVLRRKAIHTMLKYHSSDSENSEEEGEYVDEAHYAEGEDRPAHESRSDSNHKGEGGRKRKTRKVKKGKKAGGKVPKAPEEAKPSQAGRVSVSANGTQTSSAVMHAAPSTSDITSVNSATGLIPSASRPTMPVSPSRASMSASRYGSLRGRGSAANMLDAEQEALRERRRREKECEEQRQAELREFEKHAKDKVLTAWLESHNAVKGHDNLQAVLRVMHRNKTTKVYVLDERDGTPLGAVNVVDLCRNLLATEAAEKIAGFAAFRQRRHQDVVVKQVKE